MASKAGPGALTRRRFLGLVAAGGGSIALGGLLAACGAPSGDGAAELDVPSAPATGASGTTIAVWFFDETIRAPIQEFERAHPDIKVELRWPQANFQPLETLASGDDPPDVI